MPISKRVFDLLVALALTLLLWPVVLIVGLLILIKDGRPIFYVSERMQSTTQAFSLIKFRTMKADSYDSGVSGGDKARRISKTGQFLRRSRLDEIPQIWNVLRGDISFVGPRPPLRQYVEKFPDLYSEVLKSRTGLTGLASVKFHTHEEMLLSRAKTAEETDEIYSKHCVLRKANIDLIYQRNRTLCFDIRIMLATVFKKLL